MMSWSRTAATERRRAVGPATPGLGRPWVRVHSRRLHPLADRFAPYRLSLLSQLGEITATLVTSRPPWPERATPYPHERLAQRRRPRRMPGIDRDGRGYEGLGTADKPRRPESQVRARSHGDKDECQCDDRESRQNRPGIRHGRLLPLGRGRPLRDRRSPSSAGDRSSTLAVIAAPRVPEVHEAIGSFS